MASAQRTQQLPPLRWRASAVDARSYGRLVSSATDVGSPNRPIDFQRLSETIDFRTQLLDRLEPPFLLKKFLKRLFRKPILDNSCRIAGNDGEWRHIVRQHSACGGDGAVANALDCVENRHVVAYPDIVADDDL